MVKSQNIMKMIEGLMNVSNPSSSDSFSSCSKSDDTTDYFNQSDDGFHYLEKQKPYDLKLTIRGDKTTDEEVNGLNSQVIGTTK